MHKHDSCLSVRYFNTLFYGLSVSNTVDQNASRQIKIKSYKIVQ